mmetsp:Transcript_28127/g.72931  ORF Transcript_28127/g.72931 Transcript_28127/m.72931 type:complete len:255 (-) Transcript_28127:960-1724(-)
MVHDGKANYLVALRYASNWTSFGNTTQTWRGDHAKQVLLPRPRGVSSSGGLRLPGGQQLLHELGADAPEPGPAQQHASQNGQPARIAAARRSRRRHLSARRRSVHWHRRLAAADATAQRRLHAQQRVLRQRTPRRRVQRGAAAKFHIQWAGKQLLQPRCLLGQLRDGQRPTLLQLLGRRHRVQGGGDVGSLPQARVERAVHGGGILVRGGLTREEDAPHGLRQDLVVAPMGAHRHAAVGPVGHRIGAPTGDSRI